MANENRREQRRPRQRPRQRKRVRLALAAIVFTPVAICALLLVRDTRTADERLAEFEAARAVPHNQNAARIYNELLQDPHAMSLLDARPDVLHGSLFRKRLNEPWRTEDCPELAAWIEQCTPILDKLAEASQLDACRFPISIEPGAVQNTVDWSRAVRQSVWLLLFAANKDRGEGRPDAAVTKWHCLVQLANHNRQQPLVIDHMKANALMRLTFRSMARFVAAGAPSARHLQQIEAMPLPLADDWQHHREQIRLIDDLIEQKTKESLGLWDRIKYPIASYRMKRALRKAYPDQKDSPTEGTGKRYQQHIATARGLHILIALRRHRSQTGQWPHDLHEISVSLPQTILIDPLNGDPFIYRRTEDAFELYSRGRNRFDETARPGSDNGDDWPIWLPPQPKPKPRSKPEPEPADKEAEEKIMKQLKEIYGDRYRGVLYDQNDPKDNQ
jgi:hypothetical protein